MTNQPKSQFRSLLLLALSCVSSLLLGCASSGDQSGVTSHLKEYPSKTDKHIAPFVGPNLQEVTLKGEVYFYENGIPYPLKFQKMKIKKDGMTIRTFSTDSLGQYEEKIYNGPGRYSIIVDSPFYFSRKIIMIDDKTDQVEDFFYISKKSTRPLKQWKLWDSLCFAKTKKILKGEKIESENFCAQSFASAESYKVTYRQALALAHELTNATDYQRKVWALNLLEGHDCLTKESCITFFDLLESGAPPSKLIDENEFIKRVGLLKSKVKSRLQKMKLVKTRPMEGLCQINSERSYWLESFYQLYCPQLSSPLKVKTRPFSEDFFRTTIVNLSGQAKSSSSEMKSIYHDKGLACSDDWTLKIDCELNRPIVYNMNCKNNNGRIVCSERN